MALFLPRDRDAVEAFQAIDYANPFLPERVELERRILGAAYTEIGAARSLLPGAPGLSPNYEPLLARAEALLEGARKRLSRSSARATETEAWVCSRNSSTKTS